MEANPVATTLEELPAETRLPLITALEGIRAACLSCRVAYAEAGSMVVEDARLRGLFETFAQQRDAFAAQLESLVLRFGHAPRERSHLYEELRARWIDLRAALEHHSPIALIAECERADNSALKAYEDAMRLRLSLDIEAVLLDHASAIRETRADLDRMRHPW